MVKRFLNKYVVCLGKFMSYLLPITMLKIAVRIKNRFLTGYELSYFESHGDNIYIEFPFHCIGHRYIRIGDNFNTRGNCRLEAIDFHNNISFHPQMIFGKNVSMNSDCHIACVNKIIIKDNVLLASRIFITDHFHGEINFEELSIPPSCRVVKSKGPVIIEENVWIGEGVAIMPGVVIGRNSVVGANAVVTKSFPANSIIGGVPARLLKVSENK